MIISKATAQGERPYQEDRYVVKVESEGTLLAVFDGHGGSEVSEFVCEKFPPVFFAALNLVKQEIKQGKVRFGSSFAQHTQGIRHAMRATFKSLNASLKKQNWALDQGSTASVVWISKWDNKPVATCGVLGDSPIVIGRADQGIFVAPNHNGGSNEKERAAAVKRGALWYSPYLCNWNGHGLQMSRSFGDGQFQFLSRTPQVFSRRIHGFVLVATDGIIDMGNNVSSCMDGKKLHDKDITAQTIVNHSLDVPTYDNVTAILWRE